MFEEVGPRVELTGAVLLTTFGYDYVRGNLAGALALETAGPAATQVQVGYFVHGRIGKAGSAGTRASVAGVALEGGYLFRGGRIVSERTAAHVTSFQIDGKPEEAFSIGLSEDFALPRLRPRAAGQRALPRQRRSPTWVFTSAASAGPPGSSRSGLALAGPAGRWPGQHRGRPSNALGAASSAPGPGLRPHSPSGRTSSP